MKSIHVVEQNLPMAWERAVLECYEKGESFPTEYDKPEDPNSRDVSAIIHVENPMSEPRIHRAFPGGLDDLEKYRSEVLFGVHDHWINPDEGKWEYTYHQRLFNYEVPAKGLFDQIEAMVERLAKAPHTRRAQAVTYQVWNDMLIDDPTCLQRVWTRLDKNDRLLMNVHMRSNDAYKAAFMNMHSFTELQSLMADSLTQKTGRQIVSGDYLHFVDSFHIYGSYFDEFDGFRETVKQRKFEDRVYTSDFANSFFIDGAKDLLAEGDMPEDKRELVRLRLGELTV